jgi:hypothetical protein
MQPAQPKDQPHKSALALAIEHYAQNRPVDIFEVDGLLGIADKKIARIGIRVPTKAEQDAAWVGAHKYVAEVAAGVDSARGDRELLQDAQAAHIVFAFARDAEDPKHPAFPGPKWLCQNLEAERIAYLINLCNEVRAKRSPSPSLLTPDMAIALAQMVSAADAEGADPILLLATYPREVLSQAFTLLASEYVKVTAPKEEEVPSAAHD